MANFFGIVGADTQIDDEMLQSFNLFDQQGKTILRNENLLIGRNSLTKFSSSRLEFENDLYIIVTEGVFFNNSFSEETIIKLYEQFPTSFPKQLHGNFAGAIFDKRKKTLLVFNDQLSTKTIYFSIDKSKKSFSFSTRLNFLNKLFKHIKHAKSINYSSLNSLLTLGLVLGDESHLNEVKKLEYGQVLELNIESFDLKTHKYYDLNETPKFQYKSYSEIINQLNDLFIHSLKSNWITDQIEANRHLSLLSGGMDAKTNAVIAKKLGFHNISTLTFGQSDSLDVKIAQEIAQGEKFDHINRFLDNGIYLEGSIDDLGKANDYMVFFTSSAHMRSSFEKLNLQDYGGVHSGQIGDVLLGSFSKTGRLSDNLGSLGYVGKIANVNWLDDISPLPDLLRKYDEIGLEAYSYEQRQINGTLMGDRNIAHLIDHFSPFYNPDLINFCKNLPAHYKKASKIYFDWLKVYHPQVLNYKWEKIDAKPKNQIQIRGLKKYKWFINGVKKKTGFNYDSMNPFAKWLRENESISSNWDQYFQDHIGLIEDKSFQDRVRQQYGLSHDPEQRNKVAALTVLAAVKEYK